MMRSRFLFCAKLDNQATSTRSRGRWFHDGDTLCTACGWRNADVRPDYSKKLPPRTGVGWMMPPGGAPR